MKKILKIIFSLFVITFFFSLVFLIQKHNVGNDSTVSEWLINYSGGFTKRGIIGQLCIYSANLFNFELRDIILIYQILIISIFYSLIFNLLKNIEVNNIIILSIFIQYFY